jgi:hypothetical protein
MLDDKTKNDIDIIRQAVDVIAKLTINQSPLDGYLETTKDRYIQTNYGLWNTLISLNGIIVTIFSAFAATTNNCLPLKILICIVIVVSIASIIFLILCYTTQRKMYKDMFEFSERNRNKFPQDYLEEAKALNEKSIDRNRSVVTYEKVSFCLTSCAAALIFAIIFIA